MRGFTIMIAEVPQQARPRASGVNNPGISKQRAGGLFQAAGERIFLEILLEILLEIFLEIFLEILSGIFFLIVHAQCSDSHSIHVRRTKGVLFGQLDKIKMEKSRCVSKFETTTKTG